MGQNTPKVWTFCDTLDTCPKAEGYRKQYFQTRWSQPSRGGGITPRASKAKVPGYLVRLPASLAAEYGMPKRMDIWTIAESIKRGLVNLPNTA